MRFATFLFDLDGTLVDHFAAIHRAHSHTLRQLGLPAPSMAQVRAAVGGGVEVAVRRLVGAERTAEALAVYRPYWDATMLDDVALFAGA
ncbi:MAG TPA: HAD hydrolase-like protein, partial [Opitutus sp.]|nr:HAD hydrolase-like protein [Opitutus sp.]